MVFLPLPASFQSLILLVTTYDFLLTSITTYILPSISAIITFPDTWWEYIWSYRDSFANRAILCLSLNLTLWLCNAIETDELSWISRSAYPLLPMPASWKKLILPFTAIEYCTSTASNLVVDLHFLGDTARSNLLDLILRAKELCLDLFLLYLSVNAILWVVSNNHYDQKLLGRRYSISTGPIYEMLQPEDQGSDDDDLYESAVPGSYPRFCRYLTGVDFEENFFAWLRSQNDERRRPSLPPVIPTGNWAEECISCLWALKSDVREIYEIDGTCLNCRRYHYQHDSRGHGEKAAENMERTGATSQDDDQSVYDDGDSTLSSNDKGNNVEDSHGTNADDVGGLGKDCEDDSSGGGGRKDNGQGKDKSNGHEDGGGGNEEEKDERGSIASGEEDEGEGSEESEDEAPEMMEEHGEDIEEGKKSIDTPYATEIDSEYDADTEVSSLDHSEVGSSRTNQAFREARLRVGIVQQPRSRYRSQTGNVEEIQEQQGEVDQIAENDEVQNNQGHFDRFSFLRSIYQGRRDAYARVSTAESPTVSPRTVRERRLPQVGGLWEVLRYQHDARGEEQRQSLTWEQFQERARRRDSERDRPRGQERQQAHQPADNTPSTSSWANVYRTLDSIMDITISSVPARPQGTQPSTTPAPTFNHPAEADETRESFRFRPVDQHGRRNAWDWTKIPTSPSTSFHSARSTSFPSFPTTSISRSPSAGFPSSPSTDYSTPSSNSSD